MLNKIKETLACHNYVDALHLIEEHLKNGNPYTDTLAILEATVYLETQEFDPAFRCISEGLKINPLNYELYFMLGNLYETQGKLQQAYLCYENALYHCKDNKEDYSVLSSYFQTFTTTTNTLVPKVSIIIVTLNNLEYTIQCINSIRRYCSNSAYEITVVDNGSTDGTKEYLRSQEDITYQFNEENLGFSAGCNLGIHKSPQENDILLLHNDTIMTENSLFILRMALYDNETNGAAGSVSNYADKQKIPETFDTLEKYMAYGFINNIPKENAFEARILLSDFAFLIKRSAYKVVGDLDEQFFPGSYEDHDYSTRLVLNDYQLVLCKNSFIFHFGERTFSFLANESMVSSSSFYQANKLHYMEKWNINPDYSCHCRRELIDFIQEQDKFKPIKVLEIGCACGATLLGIKNQFPNASLYGIELDEHTADFASHIAKVVQGNAETLDAPFPVSFDYIIMGDILEHLVHPENLLKKIKNWLSPKGVILTSIPNILHYSAILPILRGNFAYSDAGVLDRTHLRFFTLYNSVKLLEDCGYKIISYAKNRTPESTLNDETLQFIEQLAKLPGIADKEQFFTMQYIFKAEADTK